MNSTLSADELRALRRSLLGWFRRHRRRLPWRSTHDAYRIWVSEVMLQQTRVAAAIEYYQRFLRRFPKVQGLARAPSEEVLKLWAGLGYYRRARNLHRAAKEIVTKHRGKFPREFRAALALPGVGRYTAAAVTSIAYGEPHAVLDGNVARVVARLGAVRGELRAPQRWRQLQGMAQRLLPARGFPPGRTARTNAGRRDPAPPETPAGEWNQGMMELGATVCTPRAPRCQACPLSRWCRAYRLGIVDQVPGARVRRSPVRVQLAAAVLLDPRGRTLLVKPEPGTRQGTSRLFSGMWQFPAAEVRQNARAELVRHLKEVESPSSPQRTPRNAGSITARLQELEPVRHAVTFREITLLPYLARVERLPEARGARRPRLAQISELPVSSATRKIARAAADFLKKNEK